MKQLLFTALLAFLPSTGFAFAWPSLGDTLTFDFITQLDSERLPGEYVITIDAIDEVNDKVKQTVRLAFSGSQTTKSYEVKLSELRQIAQTLPEKVARCAELGGTPETVTIPYGTFTACKVANDDEQTTGFTWIANVPGAYLKAVSTNRQSGNTTLITLKNFQSGR